MQIKTTHLQVQIATEEHGIVDTYLLSPFQI